MNFFRAVCVSLVAFAAQSLSANAQGEPDYPGMLSKCLAYVSSEQKDTCLGTVWATERADLRYQFAARSLEALGKEKTTKNAPLRLQFQMETESHAVQHLFWVQKVMENFPEVWGPARSPQ